MIKVYLLEVLYKMFLLEVLFEVHTQKLLFKDQGGQSNLTLSTARISMTWTMLRSGRGVEDL
jgi:flagellar motor protein MotB